MQQDSADNNENTLIPPFLALQESWTRAPSTPGSPGHTQQAGKHSLLHVVLPSVHLLEPGELQPPVGCVA